MKLGTKSPNRPVVILAPPYCFLFVRFQAPLSINVQIEQISDYWQG
jgi:hypothetical protein